MSSEWRLQYSDECQQVCSPFGIRDSIFSDPHPDYYYQCFSSISALFLSHTDTVQFLKRKIHMCATNFGFVRGMCVNRLLWLWVAVAKIERNTRLDSNQIENRHNNNTKRRWLQLEYVFPFCVLFARAIQRSAVSPLRQLIWWIRPFAVGSNSPSALHNPRRPKKKNMCLRHGKTIQNISEHMLLFAAIWLRCHTSHTPHGLSLLSLFFCSHLYVETFVQYATEEEKTQQHLY